ncbi:MAG: glycosyltransferase [Solirubrobacteraceae bacterium]
MRPLAGCFAASAAGAGWVLAGYPLVLSLLRPRPWRRDEDAEPAVTIVVPAFREREALAAKLAALTALDYPAERVQVLVPVDEDEVTARAARGALPSADVLFSPTRGGKAAGLNRALTEASGDIVLLTDANNLLDPGSLRAAARHFADPAIWAVAGARRESGSAYDRYEDLLRRLESRSGDVAAMSGEFMCVRRERLPRFPEDVVNDDLWLLCALVRGGGRVVYDPAACSHEPGLDARSELERRSRMGAGRLMLLAELRDLPPRFAWRLLSHKHGRLALPFLLLGAFLSSLGLGGRGPFRAVALAQIAVYGAGALAIAGVTPPGPAGRAARAAGQFLLGNAAVAAGVVRALRGRQSARWEAVR